MIRHDLQHIHRSDTLQRRPIVPVPYDDRLTFKADGVPQIPVATDGCTRMLDAGKRPGEGEVIARSKRPGDIVRYRSYTVGADTEGSIDNLSLWAGQSTGLVSSVKAAADIVREIVAEADAILRHLSGS